LGSVCRRPALRGAVGAGVRVLRENGEGRGAGHQTPFTLQPVEASQLRWRCEAGGFGIRSGEELAGAAGGLGSGDIAGRRGGPEGGLAGADGAEVRSWEEGSRGQT
jgi:hypothetical protein